MSADDEYHRRNITKAIEQRGVNFKARPSGRQNKTCIIEKMVTVKQIVELLQEDGKQAKGPTQESEKQSFCQKYSMVQALSVHLNSKEATRPPCIDLAPTS